MPVVKKNNKKRPVRKDLDLGVYIQKLGKMHFPDAIVPKASKEEINRIIKKVCDQYVLGLVAMLQHEQKKTSSSKDVQTLTKVILKGLLIRYAVSEGTKAVTKKTAYVPKRGKKRVSTAEKAGIVVSPSRVENYIRQEIAEHTLDKRVSEDMAVYLSAVLEYLINEIIELAQQKDHDKITVENIKAAIHEDEDLHASLCCCVV